MSSSSLVQIRKTVLKAPQLPYESMAQAILGQGYELSLVICGDSLATRMNMHYRKKTYSPNVLSFPYDKREGEIFLNVRKAEREARRMKIPARNRMALLFVHGCFHLMGHKHGDRMEVLEQKILRRFQLAEA